MLMALMLKVTNTCSSSVLLIQMSPNTETKLKTKLCGLSPRANYTEQSTLVDEVSVNLCGQKVPCGERDGSLRPYSRFSRPVHPNTYVAKFQQTLTLPFYRVEKINPLYRAFKADTF
jgi:hypothetical protein